MERVSFWQEVRAGYKGEFPVWVLPAWFVSGTFAGRLGTNELVEMTAVDQSNQINHPFFNKRLDFVEILRLGKPSAADLPPSRLQLDLQQLLVDRTFSNIVAGRWAAADDVLRVHTSLAELTDEILRLISKRLGEAGE